jgi:hypothetical protein
MGMRIVGSGSAARAQSTSSSQWQQRQQGVNSLMAALSAGKLGSAQAAYANMAGTIGMVAASSPLGQIGQALQKGDLSVAQLAVKSWQAGRGGPNPAIASTTGAMTSRTSGPGSLLDLTA